MNDLKSDSIRQLSFSEAQELVARELPARLIQVGDDVLIRSEFTTRVARSNVHDPIFAEDMIEEAVYRHRLMLAKEVNRAKGDGHRLEVEIDTETMTKLIQVMDIHHLSLQAYVSELIRRAVVRSEAARIVANRQL